MAVTLFHKVINRKKVKVVIRNKAPQTPKETNLAMSIKMKRDYNREVTKN